MTHPDTVDVLEGRTAPLEMSGPAFREAGHRLVEQIANWLEQMPDGPVTHDESPATVRGALGAARGLPETGADPRQLLDEATSLLFQHSLFNGHPRFFGYVTSSPAPIGALGDLLASAVTRTSARGACRRSQRRSRRRRCDGSPS